MQEALSACNCCSVRLRRIQPCTLLIVLRDILQRQCPVQSSTTCTTSSPSRPFSDSSAPSQTLAGIGPYTAAAVASIAFNDAAAAVDGNVIRVISRLRTLTGDPTKQAKLHASLAAQLLDRSRPGCHNQAMMELGATVCKPANPECGACPIADVCRARQKVVEYAAAGGVADVEDAPKVTDYPEKVSGGSECCWMGNSRSTTG